MIQLFSYGAKKVTLLYPKTEQVQTENIEFREADDDGVVVRVRFVDLFDIQNSLVFLQDDLLGKKLEQPITEKYD